MHFRSAADKAIAYVKRISRQPDQYAIYVAAGKLKGKRASDLAHTDFRLNGAGAHTQP